MSRSKSKIIKCPLCQGNLISRLSTSSYYCQDCSIELIFNKGFINVFYIYSDGNIRLIGKLQYLI